MSETVVVVNLNPNKKKIRFIKIGFRLISIKLEKQRNLII
jgi:hypothetical protein